MSYGVPVRRRCVRHPDTVAVQDDGPYDSLQGSKDHASKATSSREQIPFAGTYVAMKELKLLVPALQVFAVVMPVFWIAMGCDSSVVADGDEQGLDSGPITESAIDGGDTKDSGRKVTSDAEADDLQALTTRNAEGCYELTTTAFTSSTNEDVLQLKSTFGEAPGSRLEIVSTITAASAQTHVLGPPPNSPFDAPLHSIGASLQSTQGRSVHFEAIRGTLSYTAIPSPLTREVAGSLGSVKLVETMEVRTKVDGGDLITTQWKPNGWCIALVV